MCMIEKRDRVEVRIGSGVFGLRRGLCTNVLLDAVLAMHLRASLGRADCARCA